MNNDTESGSVPQLTIDSMGNVVPKPNGLGRWHSPRVYKCTHEDCKNAATILSQTGSAHNCCNQHGGPQ